MRTNLVARIYNRALHNEMLFSCFQVISNMPTIAVEEATPVTVDEAQTLAPEEIGAKTKVRYVNEN